MIDFSVTVRTNDNIGKDSATVWVTLDTDLHHATFYSDGKRANVAFGQADVYRPEHAAEIAAAHAWRVIR